MKEDEEDNKHVRHDRVENQVGKKCGMRDWQSQPLPAGTEHTVHLELGMSLGNQSE